MRQPYNTDLSNKEWEIIAAMMPKPSKFGRPPKTDFREVLNGVFGITPRKGGISIFEAEGY